MSVFRDGLFRNRVAFFTGGTSGIGLAIAEQFATLGATVILNGRNEEKMTGAIQAIRSRGGNAFGFAADVRNYTDLDAAFVSARQQTGLIDFLFCGAAGNFPAPVLGMSANGFKAVVDIDLLGTFNTCRAAHPHLNKPGAVVVAISANHAEVAYAMQSHVCAAKAGVELLMRTLAIEWGPQGIRTASIRPGPIDDTEGMRRLAPSEETRQAVARAIPLRRFGTRQEIADLATFLCSDAAAYITGVAYTCDGGQALAGARTFGDL
jgi:NAD(P)-dependent dehydrogenase (short-subunit alcohol dehydrogenase family)